MAFCQNCGKELPDGAKFCPQCGAAADSASHGSTGEGKSARRQEFAGTVKKCPSCGAELPSLAAICPTCGHELSDVSESEAVRKFQEGLTKYDGKEQADFIASFPVPNTREDLGNFLHLIASMLQAEATLDANQNKIVALTSKFNEISQKIVTVLPKDDPLQKRLIDSYNMIKTTQDETYARRARIKKEFRKDNAFRRKHPVLFFIMCLIISPAVLTGIIVTCETIDEKKLAHEVAVLKAQYTGGTYTFAKEKVFLPDNLENYFDVISDVTVQIGDNLSFVEVTLEVKCKKSVRDELEGRYPNLAGKEEAYVGFYLSRFDPTIGGSDDGLKLFNAKKGETVKLRLERTKMDDSDWKEMQEYLDRLKQKDTIRFSTFRAFYEIRDNDGSYKQYYFDR